MEPTYIKDICISLALVWVFELCVSDEDRVHIGAGVLVEFSVAGDHDDGYFTVTEDTQFVGLLQEPRLPLTEGYLKGE